MKKGFVLVAAIALLCLLSSGGQAAPVSAVDATLGMLQLGVRFYEPGTGRFGQRDPVLVETESGYAYCGNYPLAAIDPTGRWQWGWPPWGNPKPPTDPATEWLKKTFKDLGCKAIDLCRGKGAFPIGKLLKELDSIKKLTPSARQKVMDECCAFVESVNNPSAGSDTDQWAFCTGCCKAIQNHIGKSIMPNLCDGLCKPLLMGSRCR